MKNRGESLVWSSWVLILAIALTGCPKTAPPTDTSSTTPSPSPTELGVTVKLVATTGTEPEKVTLSVSSGSDHIRWTNETTSERKLTFAVDWPFLEAKEDIVVAAGATTSWYTLDPAKVGRGYGYEVTPPLATPADPPDEPAISAET